MIIAGALAGWLAPTRITERVVRQLERLGKRVTLEPARVEAR